MGKNSGTICNAWSLDGLPWLKTPVKIYRFVGFLGVSNQFEEDSNCKTRRKTTGLNDQQIGYTLCWLVVDLPPDYHNENHHAIPGYSRLRSGTWPSLPKRIYTALRTTPRPNACCELAKYFSNCHKVHQNAVDIRFWLLSTVHVACRLHAPRQSWTPKGTCHDTFDTLPAHRDSEGFSMRLCQLRKNISGKGRGLSTWNNLSQRHISSKIFPDATPRHFFILAKIRCWLDLQSSCSQSQCDS